MPRRLLGLVVLVVAVLLLAGCMNPDETTAFNLVNSSRATHNRAALVENNSLTSKAQAWASYLAQQSGGQCSGSTLQHSQLANGVAPGWFKLGENVGCRVSGEIVAAHVGPLQDGFMASPGHQANILDPAFNSAGIGLAWAPTPGGSVVVYEVQVFAQF